MRGHPRPPARDRDGAASRPSGRPRLSVVPALFALALAACTCNAPAAPDTPEPRSLADAVPVLDTYARILFAALSDAATGAEALEAAAQPLSSGGPTEAALSAARAAWIAARPPYLQTEVARFYGGPIDDEEHGHELLINTWPMDEAYLDYVSGPDGGVLAGGLVNDPVALPVVSAAAIAALHLRDSEENVAVGFHAIELLLWGQDLRADGPGARSHLDFAAGEGATAPNGDRRAAYLAAATHLLVEELRAVRDAWRLDVPGSYGAEFVALPPEEGIRRILVGMGTLAGTELSGERLNVPYTTQEQEDEHSCFSDTTNQDQRFDGIGLRNVYLGRYVATDGTLVSGPGLSDLVRTRDAALDARARAELDGVVDAIEAIPAPFDQAVLGADDAPGRVAIAEAIRRLRGLTATLVDVAGALGVTINLIE